MAREDLINLHIEGWLDLAAVESSSGLALVGAS